MQRERTTVDPDHTFCQAAYEALYEAAVEVIENPPPLGTQRDYLDHRLGTLGHHYHREGTAEILRERDALAEALDDLHRYSLIPDHSYARSPCEAKVRAALEAVGRKVP